MFYSPQFISGWYCFHGPTTYDTAKQYA